MANNALLEQLQSAQAAGAQIIDLPSSLRPATLEEAYATADALVGGERVVGWKIGAGSSAAQEGLGITEPFAGRILEGTVYDSPASLPTGTVPWMVEAEFTFRLARDVEGDGLDATTIVDYLDAVIPSFELLHLRYSDVLAAGGLLLTAANGINAGLVRGEATETWTPDEIRELPVTVSVNGEQKGRRAVRDAGFDPFAVLAWLANDRARRGDPLRAGQLVATGDVAGPQHPRQGDVVQADFGRLGSIRFRLE